LRHFVTERFKNPQAPYARFRRRFGYRYGVAHRADLVFDVRFLPILISFRGCVASLVRSKSSPLHPLVSADREFLKRIEGLLVYLIPHYIQEGKSYLTIAIGCTAASIAP